MTQPPDRPPVRRDTVTDDELERLVWRCIDGDLPREQRVDLFAALADDPAAIAHLKKSIAIERQLASVAHAYRAEEVPEPALTVSVAPAPGRSQGTAPRPSRPGAPWRGLWPRMLLAGAVGAIAAGVALHALGPPSGAGTAAQASLPRIQGVAIAFQQPADAHEWHAHHTVAPGTTVTLAVHAGKGALHHLRLHGTQALDVEVTHSRPGQDDIRYEVNRGMVHYAVLHSPQNGDLLRIRNRGPSTFVASLAFDRAGTLVAQYASCRPPASCPSAS